MPQQYIQHANGHWYSADDQGNIIYTEDVADGDGVLTREVATGNMVDDPTTRRNIYSVTGYGDSDLDGYRLSKLGRQKRRQSINSLIGKRNQQTKFEKYIGRDLRRRDFRDEAFVQDLVSRTYTGSDFSSKSDGDRYASSVANRIQNIAYPTLRKKVSQGGYDKVIKPTYTVFWERADCPECGIGQSGFKRIVTGYRRGLKKRDAAYATKSGGVQSDVEYDRMPEMTTEYASPIQLISRSSVENRQLETSTPPTSNTTRRVKPKTSVKMPTSLVTKPKVTSSTNAKTRPVAFTQQRTTTWQELPDGTRVDLVVGDWENIK